MLEFERIDVSDGIDADMTNKSKCFVITGIFYIKTLAKDHVFVMVAIT